MITITAEKKENAKYTGDLYGIFFEDLNHAADGGLYGELIRNRAFEFCPADNPSYTHLTAWKKNDGEGEVNLVIETGSPVSQKNPHYLGIDIIAPGENTGVINTGYSKGIPAEAGKIYDFSFYARREQMTDKKIKVQLVSKDGKAHAESEFCITDSWQKYEAELSPDKTDDEYNLLISAEGRGKVYIDFVSLFPRETFNGRKNGLRKDLAEKLKELKPAFLRFPGGCLVHDGSLNSEEHDSQYRWKNSIGRIEDRPSRRNNWGYNQSLGLGFYEYFLLCEDIGAKPLPVLPAGYDPHHFRACSMDKMQEFIHDALDLVEFANGSPETPWGKIRTELGHEKTFNLEYLGIGNEEVGEDFPPRFKIIRDAVKEKYPELKIIGSSGPFAGGSEFELGWNKAKEFKADLVDEHYYMAPEWFIENARRYMNYSAEGPHVFLGEYASWGNTWKNALYEAAFMTFLEKAPAVHLACYAPLFCHTDYVNWKPDMIWFNSTSSITSANYEIQKLFMHNTGDTLVNTVSSADGKTLLKDEEPDSIPGKIYLSFNTASVFYSDIILTEIKDDGKISRSKKIKDCTVNASNRKVSIGKIKSKKWKLTLNAKELSAKQGFRIYFGETKNRRFLWEIGGWQNQDSAVCEEINGRSSCLHQHRIIVQRNTDYKLTLECDGKKIKAYINGVLFHDTESKPFAPELLYQSLTEDNEYFYFKSVNVLESGQEVSVSLEGTGCSAAAAEMTLYEGFPTDAENTFEKPFSFKPKKGTVSLKDNHLIFTMPAFSAAAFKIKKRQ
ncbi:alpha-L-arabinofuranosidase C-terminal domain-containing protein [Treponema sp.]|uniref:alpha-L-arabinofuranosidase C-terminal domain-containing protein n=1 Tax=Treponema sp. TaxID=166 RepID=UPI0025806ACE|nr:alpha-L-arabinofuranosidase C-terminal domain-containing protein [Treponema sp.]MBE6353620.1 alpha-L-arabinofuranosidase [Treponema sp.]